MTLLVKNMFANSGDIRDAGLIPGSGRSLGGRQGNPLQCFHLENPMDRGATVQRVTKSRLQLSMYTLNSKNNLFLILSKGTTLKILVIIGPKMPQSKELYETMLKHLSTESLKNFISNVGWLNPLDDCFSMSFTIQLDVTYYS